MAGFIVWPLFPCRTELRVLTGWVISCGKLCHVLAQMSLPASYSEAAILLRFGDKSVDQQFKEIMNSGVAMFRLGRAPITSRRPA